MNDFKKSEKTAKLLWVCYIATFICLALAVLSGLVLHNEILTNIFGLSICVCMVGAIAVVIISVKQHEAERGDRIEEWDKNISGMTQGSIRCTPVEFADEEWNNNIFLNPFKYESFYQLAGSINNKQFAFRRLRLSEHITDGIDRGKCRNVFKGIVLSWKDEKLSNKEEELIMMSGCPALGSPVSHDKKRYAKAEFDVDEIDIYTDTQNFNSSPERIARVSEIYGQILSYFARQEQQNTFEMAMQFSKKPYQFGIVVMTSGQDVTVFIRSDKKEKELDAMNDILGIKTLFAKTK